MFNTGSSLRHRCEGSYNQYRRFLISNKGAKFNNKILKQEIGEITGSIQINKFREGMADAVWAIDYLRRRTKNSSHLETFSYNKIDRNYHPKLNCHKCSVAGLHTPIFDFPWVTHCPVHSVKLMNRCAQCNQTWPTMAELAKRECSACGTNVSFEDLTRHRFRKSESQFDDFDAHKNLIDSILPKYIPRINLVKRSIVIGNYQKQYENTLELNRPNWFTMSVLSHLEVVPKKIQRYLSKHQVPLIPVDTELFSINAVGTSKSESEFSNDQVNDTLKLAAKKIKSEIQLQLGTDHYLGNCQNDESACFLCSTWLFWKQIVGLQSNKLPFGSLSFKRNQIQVLNGIIPNLNFELAINLYSPGGIVSEISWSPFQPPKNLQTKLLYLDAIELFIKIYIVITRQRLLAFKGKKMSLIDLQELIPRIVWRSDQALIPKHICKLDDQWVLAWPKLNLRMSMTDLDTFWRLDSVEV